MAEMIGIFRRPLIPTFVAYALGIYVGPLGPSPSAATWIIALLVLSALWTLLLVRKRRTAATGSATALFFVLGILSIHPYLHPSSGASSISRFIGMEGVIVEGTLDRPPLPSHERTPLYLRAQRVRTPEGFLPVEGRILIYSKERYPSFQRGDRLRLRCRLHRPHGFRNPGGFSYEHYLSLQRIEAIGFLFPEGACAKIGGGSRYSFYGIIERMRTHIRIFIERETEPPSSGIIKALVLGERGDIPEEISEHFTVAGIAHLLAISGDHLGIVAFLSFSLILWFLKRSELLLLSLSVKKWAAALTIPFILLYMFIAGAGISVVRATIMVLTFFLSVLFSRERDLIHTLALAAFLILVFSPPSLFDVSFQLSFLAVLSILYLVPLVLRWWQEEPILPSPAASWKVRLRSYLKISLVVTAVAILGTAPFVALHFNRISLIGFLTNLFFVPWVGLIIVPFSLMASLLSFFLAPPAALLFEVNDFITTALLRAVSLSASVPYASLYVSTPTAFEILLFYLLLVTAAHLRKRRSAKYLFIGCCIALVVNFMYWNVRGWFEKRLRITFLDVGQGDSIFVEFPKGKRMLIDGGGLYGDRFDIGKNVIAPFLWKKKIHKIDFLVLTHPDPDHLKGLNFIASHFSIGQFWDNGSPGNSESYVQLQETLKRKKVKRLIMNDQSPVQMIDGIELFILNPPGRDGARTRGTVPSQLNNDSLVMRIQFGRISVLLTGDIEKDAEYRMVKKDLPIKADLLKIPHHGSATSSTKAFLERVRPSYAVLSGGGRNLGRLPHPEVLERYERLGTKVFRTDWHGAITVLTDGERMEIETFSRSGL